MSELELFIKKLMMFESTNTVDNQYKNKYISNNLGYYLKNMYLRDPKVLLVGEAPGYKGGKLTGIPFTDEYNMIMNSNGILGSELGYRVVHNTNSYQKENSAKIVWEILEQYEIYPLMWNAFPFHPHKAGDKECNRTPLQCELNIGKQYIQELLNMYPRIEKVIAVGKKAESSLQSIKLGCVTTYIRHPSFGGKNDFEQGIKELAAHHK